jgi:hypothetical protein
MNKFDSKLGSVFVFDNGHKMEVIEYFGAKNITVKFDDGIIVKNATYDNFIKGSIKNYNYPIIYNVGYFGYGDYSRKNHPIFYNIWKGMIARCYDDKELFRRPSYIGCTVDSFFLNFQNFARWCESNYVYGFKIDKDILIKGNKIYGPQTCCFVPSEINGLFVLSTKKRGNYPLGVSKSEYNKFVVNASIENQRVYLGSYDCQIDAFNVYKNHKENRIKFLANKHKSEITTECYNALINWTIDIND